MREGSNDGGGTMLADQFIGVSSNFHPCAIVHASDVVEQVEDAIQVQ